jgi:hypothetical protein
MHNSGNLKRDLRISRTIVYRLSYKDKLATMLLICGINYISEIRNAFLQCPPLLWCICYMWFYSCDVNVLVLNSSPNQLHLWSNDLSMYKTICGLSNPPNYSCRCMEVVRISQTLNFPCLCSFRSNITGRSIFIILTTILNGQLTFVLLLTSYNLATKKAAFK